ncbi:hypothetical protein BJ742DRAFT_733948 [Cladochytrium replicatum]|nr:hypothetical protein BJ742DRAFT_733948 [Cladochytrium replicatum]
MAPSAAGVSFIESVPASWAWTVTAHITKQELTEPSVDADQQQQHCSQPQGGECPVEANEWFIWESREVEAGGWEEHRHQRDGGKGQAGIKGHKGSCGVTPDNPEQGIVGNG